MDNNIKELIDILRGKINEPHEWNGLDLILTNFDDNAFGRLRILLPALQTAENGDQDEMFFTLNRNFGTSNLVFYDQAHFQTEDSYTRYKDCWDDVNIILLMPGGEMVIKEINEAASEKNLPIYNYIYYRKILDFLVSKPEFSSLHLETDLQFVILSAEKGPYYIGYTLVENRVATEKSFVPEYEDLVKNFQKMEFAKFFIDIVIEGTHSAVIKERFWKLVTNLSGLISLANRDLQIYLQKFAFEKIKSKFKEEKVKYFESLEKNIESLNKQVLAFPLTFAASVFAGFQVKDSGWILYIIFTSYALYTIVAWKILGLIRYNIKTTEQDVDGESERIKTTYQVVFSEFKGDFDKIKRKIQLVKQLHRWLHWILGGLLVLFFAFTVAYNKQLNEAAIVVKKVRQDSLQRLRNIVTDSLQISTVSSPKELVLSSSNSSVNKRADTSHSIKKEKRQ
jgi:hypothetical protein